ncbi:MAG: ABC transporter permease [Coxiellaceae bacterium]|nr:ABC transporter permease [Coxiellaceae bacterium]
MKLISEAFLNLFSAKLRSFLAILGVLVGTGSVVALISSSQLATAHALSEFKKLGTNLLSVYIRDENPGAQNTNSKQFELSDVPAIQAASKQIALIAPYTVSFQSLYYGDTNLNGQIIGATNTFAEIAKINLKAGRFVSYLDAHNFYCVLGSDIAEKIEEAGANPMNNQIRAGDMMFTVIGVLKKWPDNLFIAANINGSIIVPLETSYLLSKNTEINNVLIRLVPHPDVSLAKSDIGLAMKTLLPQKTAIFNSPEQLIKMVAKSRETMSLLLIAIGSISLVVGGIGVMNIMLVSVIERRREIGIRMAIGARQIDILRMFLLESILLTVFGGLLGIGIGVLSSYIFAMVTGWQFYFYLTPVVLGFVVSVLVGIISGFYPAWRASKLDPILCMTT